jgi:signal transduction histidine kinase
MDRKGAVGAVPKAPVTDAEPDVIARLARAEADLAALRKELEHSQQLATLGTLTAGIAHEINNILTPVLAYAQLAWSNPSDLSLRTKALERTIAGVQSASRITEAVLGFARADSEADRAVIAEVVDSSLACLGRDPARDGIRVLVDVEPTTAVRIQPLALQQVFLNLILNAMTAMEGKPGELRISARRRGDRHIDIRFMDTGPGVPPEMTERIFQPFFSGHRRKGPRKPRSLGGAGLGLAVCRRLIENVGGTIGLEARTDAQVGASFLISLVAA